MKTWLAVFAMPAICGCGEQELPPIACASDGGACPDGSHCGPSESCVESELFWWTPLPFPSAKAEAGGGWGQGALRVVPNKLCMSEPLPEGGVLTIQRRTDRLDGVEQTLDLEEHGEGLFGYQIVYAGGEECRNRGEVRQAIQFTEPPYAEEELRLFLDGEVIPRRPGPQDG